MFVGAPMYSQEAEAGNFDNGRVAVFRLHGVSSSRLVVCLHGVSSSRLVVCG